MIVNCLRFADGHLIKIKIMETLELQKVEVLYPMNEITLKGTISKGNLSYPTQINCDTTILNKVLGYLQTANGLENTLSSYFTNVKGNGVDLYELDTEHLEKKRIGMELLETCVPLLAIRA